MDTKKYNTLMNDFSNNLEGLEKDIDTLVNKQYFNENRLRSDSELWDTVSGVHDINNTIDRATVGINDLKFGISEESNYYHGFDAMSREYTRLKNKVKYLMDIKF